MRKLILFIFVIILPATIVGISNFFVFPDSSWAATIMLIVTVGISAVFTWQSGNATRRVSVYSLCADFVIAVILAVNLAGHWILSREYSASKQGVAERRLEEDREELRSQARVERELALKKADKDLQDSERRRLRLLPPDQRHSTLATPKVDPTKVPLIQPMSLLPPGSKVETFSKLSPEEVLAKWWWRLTGLAIAEVLASVVAGGLLFGIWEWDRDHNNIPDRLQRYSREPDLGK